MIAQNFCWASPISIAWHEVNSLHIAQGMSACRGCLWCGSIHARLQSAIYMLCTQMLLQLEASVMYNAIDLTGSVEGHYKNLQNKQSDVFKHFLVIGRTWSNQERWLTFKPVHYRVSDITRHRNFDTTDHALRSIINLSSKFARGHWDTRKSQTQPTNCSQNLQQKNGKDALSGMRFVEHLV